MRTDRTVSTPDIHAPHTKKCKGYLSFSSCPAQVRERHAYNIFFRYGAFTIAGQEALSLIIGHAFWDGKRNKFAFWCELTDLFFSARTRGQKGLHPYALRGKELKNAALAFSGSTAGYSMKEEMVSLLLPTQDAVPLPSDFQTAAEGNGAFPVTLFAWRIPSLTMSPHQTLSFFAGFEDEVRVPFVPSPALGYWRDATRFALEMVSRGCFNPVVSIAGADGHTIGGGWETYYDEQDGRRLKELSDYMPRECMASQSSGADSRRGLLKSFINSMLDAFVRESVGNADFSKGSHEHALPELYMNTLGTRGNEIESGGREVSKFHAVMEEWLGNLRTDTLSTGLRTCFRIEQPDPKDIQEGTELRWKLIFQMQAREDPSLVIPARKIWDSRDETMSYLGNRFGGNIQEAFLEDLGRASNLSPEIEKGLEKPEPASVELSTDEAYDFLKDRAPLLEQSGFGIMAPPWWKKPEELLGIKLKVRPVEGAQSSSTGLFGISSLADFDWSFSLGNDSLTADEVEKLMELKVPLVSIRGKWVEVRKEDIQKALAFFRKLHRKMAVGEAFTLGLGGGKEETGLHVTGFEAEGWIGQMLESMKSREKMPLISEPDGFSGKLRPYQARGVSWLTFMNRFGFGVCLADDMGLGKTVQMIASILHTKIQTGTAGMPPSLLICPTSIVGNWDIEISRFAPGLRTLIHHGSGRLSEKEFLTESKKHDIVITTYAIALRDNELLSRIEWNHLILDEAQNIKNPVTKQRRAIAALKASRKVALTGTPIENRLSELWSIMDFLNPGYLGNMRLFDEAYVKPIERLKNISGRETLRGIISPFMLRRLKTDRSIIRDLPEKMEMKVHCNLTEEQTTLYEGVVRDMLIKIQSAEGIERRGIILSTLTKLKQICNHPALFLHDRSTFEGRSGKTARLVEMLEEAVSEGDRSLVFTQYAEMGGMLQSYLREKLGCDVMFLHGGTPKKQRDFMVRNFQGSQYAPPVFVLSLKAGGLGLNLTAANRVFHFDRWWNPAVENQATDRAFRIGQKKNVLVHKFVSTGTLEEKIDLLIESKKELAESIVGSSEGWITELSTDQLREMLVLNTARGV